AVGTTYCTSAPQLPASFVTAKSSGQFDSTGAVVSCKITVWLHAALLPQSSVACHVRTADKTRAPSALVTVPAIRKVAFPHAALAAGESKSHALPHSTVLFDTHVDVSDSGATVYSNTVAQLELRQGPPQPTHVPLFANISAPLAC